MASSTDSSSPRKSPVGLKAIAIACNVSINTVSRALRDCSDISTATKNRIRAKAIEMGYVPNRLASALKSGSTKSVYLIFNNLKSPYFTIMANRIVYLLQQQGYNTLIAPNFSISCTKENVQQALLSRAEGIITFLEPTEEAVLIAKLNALPMVLVGRRTEFEGVDQIYTDDVKGGYLAAEYLISKGCRKLLYISADGLECSVRRLQGFRTRAFKEGCFVENVSESDMGSVLEGSFKKRYDGVFCFNEQIALKFASLMEQRFPEERIPIVGYDGLINQIFACQNIPCVSYDATAIADESFKVLMDRIEDFYGHSYVDEMYDVKMINLE